MEQTYMMIKPEIVAAEDQKIGEILAMVQRNGFRIRNMAMKHLDRPTVETFYAVHAERPFFADLVAYICSGPVVALHLERENAIVKLRELVGASRVVRCADGDVHPRVGIRTGGVVDLCLERDERPACPL